MVTAPPYYPEWKVHDGYPASGYCREQVCGAHVWRCPLYVPLHPSGLRRILHLASFALSSFPIMLRHVFWRPDVIWAVEPALMCAPVALLTAKLSGAKTWLHVQDFEIDAAFDLGLLKGPLLRRFVLAVERWLMRRFDRVSTISVNMHRRLLEKGVEQQNTRMFINWVDLDHLARPSLANIVSYRRELNLAADAVIVLYSGSMGRKQGLEVLAEVVSILAREVSASNQRTLNFVFCGNGPGRAELEDRCQGLCNVRFMDLQPAECLPALLSLADIHLLPQRADAADLVMPSKLSGMLASGRPVIATAMTGTEVATIVRHCGVVVPPGDVRALIEALLLLARDRAMRELLGAKAKVYAETHLAKETILRQFDADLRGLTGEC